MFISSSILCLKSHCCQKSLAGWRTQLCYSSLLTVSSAFLNKKVGVSYSWWILFRFFSASSHLISLSLVLEVIVITRKEIQKMLNLDTKMKLDFVCISDNMDMGTADSLRHIHQKIKVLLSFLELDWKLSIYNFFVVVLWGVSFVMILCITEFPDLQRAEFCVTSGGNSHRDSEWLELRSGKAGACSGWALAASWSVLVFSQGNEKLYLFLQLFDTMCGSCCPPGAWRSSSAQTFFAVLGNAVVLKKVLCSLLALAQACLHCWVSDLCWASVFCFFSAFVHLVLQ